jgi:hypothetical protein
LTQVIRNLLLLCLLLSQATLDLYTLSLKQE